MADEPAVDATAEDITAEEIETALPPATDLVVHDPSDDAEMVWVLDRHDVAQIVSEVQHRAMRVWVYDLPASGGGGRRRELSYKGVRDIVGLMNQTGRVKIGLMPETLKIERHREVTESGPEMLVTATIFARDEVTGQVMPGVATEPLYMRLKKATADAKRRDGKDIPEDGRVFDSFAETKAVNKATRNAFRAFIPEEAAQLVLAAFTGDSSRVQRIQTSSEAKLAELPPPLTDDRAVEQQARCREIYDEIRELGGGKGKLELTPGVFHAYLTQAAHSHERLDDMIGYLESERERIAAKFTQEAAA